MSGEQHTRALADGLRRASRHTASVQTRGTSTRTHPCRLASRLVAVLTPSTGMLRRRMPSSTCSSISSPQVSHAAPARQSLTHPGGDVNIADADGDTPLYTVEDVDTARVLVEHGAYIHVRNNEGISVRSLFIRRTPAPTCHSPSSISRTISHTSLPFSSHTSDSIHNVPRCRTESLRLIRPPVSVLLCP